MPQAWFPPACLPSAPGLPVPADFFRRVPRHRYSLGTIGLFLHLVVWAACSGRATAVVLKEIAALLPGPEATPCANTGRTWLLRVGLFELTCPKERAEDWVWLVDHTVQLGAHKGLIVVGLRLSVWQEAPRPLEHRDLRLLHLAPTERSDGEIVRAELKAVAAKTGVPRQIVSDGGSDLKRGIKLFREDHPDVAPTYDIKHKTALLLKHELEKDEAWGKYVSQANLARRGLTLTPSAFLVPPGLKTQARYMNLDRLVRWGEDVLGYLDNRCWSRFSRGPASRGQSVKARVGRSQRDRAGRGSGGRKSGRAGGA